MKKIARFIIFTGVILSVSAYLTSANDAPLRSVGKTIQPRNDVPVRMMGEKIKISISSMENNDVYVSCLFYLQNNGPPDTVCVGFPITYERELIDFRTRADRKPLTVETVAVNPPPENPMLQPSAWKTFKVPFDSTGQLVTVMNTYRTQLSRGGEGRLSDLLFTYIMTTGAYWEDDIEIAKVSVFLDDIPFDQITHISPAGYKLEGKRIKWQFEYFEPTENIQIRIMRESLYERLVHSRKILEESPNNAHAHFLLGTVLLNRGKKYSREEAEEEFRKAIALNQEHWDARWYLAHTLLYPRKPHYRPKEAMTQLEAIIAGKPDYQCTDKVYLQMNVLYSSTRDMMETVKRAEE